MSLGTARRLYLAAATLLVACHYAVPAARTAMVAASGALGIAGIWLGVVRLRPARWRAWVWISVAVVLLTVGVLGYAVVYAGTPGPAVPDVVYLAAYLPLAVGLLLVGRPPLASHDWPMILDTAAAGLAAALALWVVAVRPTASTLGPGTAGAILSVALCVGSGAVLAASVRMMLTWRNGRALALLALGVAALLLFEFVPDRFWSDDWRTGSVVDTGVLLFNVLAGRAAMAPSVPRIASAAYARHHVGPGGLSILAVALLVAPTVLLVEATSGAVTTGVAIAVVSAAVGLLVLVRLWLSVRSYRHRVGSERAVAAATRALVVATTETEVLDGTRTALAVVLAGRAPGAVRLVDRAPGEGGGASLSPLSGDGAAGVSPAGELRVPVPDTADEAPGRAVALVGPLARFVELQPVVETLATQAAWALHRILTTARLRAEERERYFRTLVHVSRDVILISRAGRIVYGTPSARSMFGRDVVGQRVDALVHRLPTDGASRPDPAADSGDGYDGYVCHADGDTATVLVHRRDLTEDATVDGVVTTLRDVTAERRLERDLTHRARHDALTGLANAAWFRDRLFAEPAPDAPPLAPGAGRAALYVDLDDFKAVNDGYGHTVGDGLLVVAANRIAACVRKGDLAARLGGDEFAVLLHDVQASAARATARRIAEALARPATVAGIEVGCRASIGLAFVAGRDARGLLQRADAALYAAKAQGKGLWVEYHDGMPAPGRRRIGPTPPR